MKPGGRPRRKARTKHTTFRLSGKARGLLLDYAREKGISLTAAMELMIREAAAFEAGRKVGNQAS